MPAAYRSAVPRPAGWSWATRSHWVTIATRINT